ncbi:MAG: beta-ketoacyl synthase chain length factor [Hydrogenophaga sp.]|uniref:beta-ketoacyl synthase chain length factor n=1 Tax=Hydrogenophaga sp. TaxID=1904254 RepID=UPI001D836AC3|nr:beta-ketoacyl synthase chain length factor [Hydrogenophaga sp.]MBX3609924.1 beta-ketoacyl synthase chain length factor [Hydrogenophaga sp.]
MSAPSVWLHGVSLIAPGLPDWGQTARTLRGEQAWTSAPTVLPVAERLPAAERRRASRVVRVALALGWQALGEQDPAPVATVFSSSGADGHNCHALCEQLAGSDRAVSPTRFHNSVHNAAAGYWGIASRSMAPSQVLCAYDASFGAGWLDAVGQLADGLDQILLVVYDSEYPEPLHTCRPVPDVAGVALWLGTQARETSLGQLQGTPTREPPTTMADGGLDGLRQAFPSLRALPLLQAIAKGQTTRAVIDHLAPLHLELRFTPR